VLVPELIPVLIQVLAVVRLVEVMMVGNHHLLHPHLRFPFLLILFLYVLSIV
jgi:hypothetical protein